MESKPTQADKALYFLDNVIKNGLEMYFPKLLQAMENYGGPVKQLAVEIKEKIEMSKYRHMVVCCVTQEAVACMGKYYMSVLTARILNEF